MPFLVSRNEHKLAYSLVIVGAMSLSPPLADAAISIFHMRLCSKQSKEPATGSTRELGTLVQTMHAARRAIVLPLALPARCIELSSSFLFYPVFLF